MRKKYVSFFFFSHFFLIQEATRHLTFLSLVVSCCVFYTPDKQDYTLGGIGGTLSMDDVTVFLFFMFSSGRDKGASFYAELFACWIVYQVIVPASLTCFRHT